MRRPSIRDADAEPGPVVPASRPLLHPASGAGILALDWILFSGTALSAGAATPLVCAAGFVLGFATTYACQRRAARESP